MLKSKAHQRLHSTPANGVASSVQQKRKQNKRRNNKCIREYFGPFYAHLIVWNFMLFFFSLTKHTRLQFKRSMPLSSFFILVDLCSLRSAPKIYRNLFLTFHFVTGFQLEHRKLIALNRSIQFMEFDFVHWHGSDWMRRQMKPQHYQIMENWLFSFKISFNFAPLITVIDFIRLFSISLMSVEWQSSAFEWNAMNS